MTQDTQQQTPAEEPTDIESFSAAFTEALSEEAVEKKEEPNASAADASDDAAAAGDAASAGDDAAGEEAAASDSGAAADAGAETAGEDEGEQAEDAGAKAAADKPVPAAKAPKRVEAAETDDSAGAKEGAGEAQPDYSPEDIEFLNNYTKEWPDVARAEALIRRSEYTHVVKHIFAEINRVYGPVLGVTDRIETEEHLGQIMDAHSDYEAVYDDVVAWIEKQPSYLKSAYKKVQAEGTAEEVADLVTRWKTETGYVAPEQNGAAGSKSVQQPAARTDIPAKAKQAARRLSVVNGKRASVDAGAGDPGDFSSAFAEALKA